MFKASYRFLFFSMEDIERSLTPTTQVPVDSVTSCARRYMSCLQWESSYKVREAAERAKSKEE